MEMELRVKGELYEDSSELKMFMLAPEMHSAIGDVKELIRRRLKYEEVGEDEIQFLEEIRELLFLQDL